MAALSFQSSLIFFLIASMCFIKLSNAGGEGSLTAAQCPAACDYRCSNTQHRNNCLLFCNQCCRKCLCVPSGTYGNKKECPCYNNRRTKEGRPKCP